MKQSTSNRLQASNLVRAEATMTNIIHLMMNTLTAQTERADVSVFAM